MPFGVDEQDGIDPVGKQREAGLHTQVPVDDPLAVMAVNRPGMGVPAPPAHLLVEHLPGGVGRQVLVSAHSREETRDFVGRAVPAVGAGLVPEVQRQGSPLLAAEEMAVRRFGVRPMGRAPASLRHLPIGSQAPPAPRETRIGFGRKVLSAFHSRVIKRVRDATPDERLA